MTKQKHTVAISAVPLDTLLISELCDRLAPWAVPIRLGVPAGTMAQDGDVDASSGLTTARIVLVLHQRLWRHDAAVQATMQALRQRVLRTPKSVYIVTLDSEPVPDWLKAVPRCALSAEGIEGVVSHVTDALDGTSSARRRTPSSPTQAVPTVTVSLPPDTPPPFLEQSRALTVLRRELDALVTALTPPPVARGSIATDRPVELHAVPDRFIVQMGSVGVSFSWLGARRGSVAEGRLLVIEWEGLSARSGGMQVLKSAAAVREQTYRPEAEGPEGWRWRAETPNGQAHSTATLAATWLTGVTIAAREWQEKTQAAVG